jgi:hypothetical protein
LIGWANKGTCQIARRSKASADGGVSESFPEFLHDLLADRSTLRILVGRIKRRKTNVRASLGDEDLILSQVGGRGVVLAMSDAPRVERNPEADCKVNTPEPEIYR